MTLRRSDDFDVIFSGVGGLPYGLQSGVFIKNSSIFPGKNMS